MTRLLNMLLRGLTLFSKFVLIVALARLLPPEQVGLYGLLVVTVMYALYFIGFDFYTYSTREFLKKPRSEWGWMIKSQVVLWLLSYIVFMPLMSVIFYLGWVPLDFVFLFFFLLVLEHFSQELYRFYVAISYQLLASVILFLRAGLWSLLAVLLMAHDVNLRNLDFVLFAWLAGGFLAATLGVLFLYRLKIGGWSEKVDWLWIKKGVATSLLLLLASLSLRAIFTLDRYVFEVWNGLDVLAAYVLYIGIANALMSFLDAGVYAFAYPKIISAFSRQDSCLFKRQLVILFPLSLFFIALYSLLLWVTLPFLLDFLGRPVYVEHVTLLPWLLLAVALYSFSMIPHYGLYAQHHDRAIFFSHVLAFVFFVIAVALVSSVDRYLAVPVSLCVSSLFLLIWKTHLLYKYSEPKYLPRLRWMKNYA